MIATLAVLIPAFAIMLYGLHNTLSADSFASFYKMDRSATADEYRDTTVAYSLQIAVTAYFIYWGYTYGWGNLFYIGTWYLGLFALSLACPRLLAAVNNHDTLFEFIASASRPLRTIAAVVTSISLIGLVYVELFFTARFTSTAVAAGGEPGQAAVWFWIVFVGIGISAALYTAIGGMRKVVATDQLQIGAAYLSSAIVLLSLLSAMWLSEPVAALLIAAAAIVTYLGIGLSSGWARLWTGVNRMAVISGLIILVVISYLALRWPEAPKNLRLPRERFLNSSSHWAGSLCWASRWQTCCGTLPISRRFIGCQ